MTKVLPVVIGALLLSVAVAQVNAAKRDSDAALQIRAEFERELPLVLAELQEGAVQRIDEFQRKAETSIPDIAYKLAVSMGEFDGYLTRAQTNPDDLEKAIVELVQKQSDLGFLPIFDAALHDLIQDEEDARSRLLIAKKDTWQGKLREAYSLRLVGLRGTFFFRDLSENAGLVLKTADDALEFAPWLGWLYGGSKIVYDYRIEHNITKPAVAFYDAALKESLAHATTLLNARYTNVKELERSFRSDWSASDALSRIRGK